MEVTLCPDQPGDDAIAADPSFRLIETFRCDPGRAPLNLSLHLKRMERSARAFGIEFARAKHEAELAQLRAEDPLRCRLTLSAEGRVELATAPLLATANLWHVSLATQRLCPDDIWLRHKTSRRAVYNTARAALPDGIDELLFLNERGEVCEGTITNLFVTLKSGRRVTPPVSSGLLPGILRQRLLEEGRVTEQVVTLADLQQAQSLSVGNSLRGEIPVQFHDT